MDKLYAMIGAVAFSVMINLVVEYMPVEEVKAVERIEEVQEMQEVKAENDYIESTENVKVIHNEVADVKSVYYDEAYQSWYVVCDGWALEGTEESVKDLVGGQVKIEFYVVEGEEIVNGWGQIDENGNYIF
jgi:hypothetical protein